MAITYLSGNRIQGLSTDILETPTYSTDFSSSTGWTTSSATYNQITNGRIEGNWYRSGHGDQQIYYDFGDGAVSDTAWVSRFAYVRNSLTAGNTHGFIGLSSTNTPWSSPSDRMNFYVISSGSGAPNDSFDFFSGDNTSGNGAGGTFTRSTGITPISTGTTYYVELSRNGSTFGYKIFSDSSYSTVLFSGSHTMSGTISNLRYFKFGGWNIGDGSSASSVNYLDDLKFWNGVTSLTSKPTNVPANSRFEETDTRKIFYYDGSIAVSPDTLGSEVDGTQTNVGQTSAGKIGNAYLFNGSNSYITLGNSLSQWNFMHNQSALWSAVFWYKSTNAPSGTEKIFNTATNPASAIGMAFQVQENRQMRIMLGNGSALFCDLTTTNNFVPDDNWNFYTITYDQSLGSVNCILRKNDTTQETANKTGGTPSNSNAGNSANIARSTASGQFLDGSLDELSIWNRILTSAEITTLYNSGVGRTVPDAIAAGVSATGLKAYYNFEQTSGNLINNAKSTAWSQVT